MTKMLVVDFYNTLIDREDAISTSTMLGIDTLKQEGIKLTIITNRLLDEVLYYNESYPFIDYIISLNGGVIYDVLNNKKIYGNKLDNKTISNIFDEYKDYNIESYKDDNDTYKLEVELKRKDIKDISNYKYPVFRLDNNYYLEISNNNTYDALCEVMKIEGIDNSEVVTVIGNLSEKDFIKNIDETYVVSNALKELKSMTDNRTKSNNSNGVLNVIRKVII